MNIFAAFACPVLSAKYLDDKRVVKMVLESAQLLSTAITFCGGKGPYKTTHVNHPCSIWARSSTANYKWLLDHFLALSLEYYHRYGKIHKCYHLYDQLLSGMTYIPHGPLTPHPNCTTLKHLSDTHYAYRAYLRRKWVNDKRPPARYRISI